MVFIIPAFVLLLIFLGQHILAEQDCVRKPFLKPLQPQSEMKNLSGKKVEALRNTQNLRIPFVANEGQSDEQVRFYAKTFGGTVFVTKDGEIVYSLQGNVVGQVPLAREMGYGPRITENGIPSIQKPLDVFLITLGDPISGLISPDADYAISSSQVQDQKSEKFRWKSRANANVLNEARSSRPIKERDRVRGVALKEKFVNGKVSGIQGRDRAATKVNYFKGNDPSQWKTNISAYDVITLGEVYKGIELRLKAYGNTVEKLFYVRPGADPNQIRIELGGAQPHDLQEKGEAASPFSKENYYGNSSVKIGTKELSVNEHGELEVETEIGTVKFTRPVAFQEINGKRVEVAVEYAIQNTETRSLNGYENVTNVKSAIQNQKSEYGFNVASYDKTKDLVIDPAIAYSTYLGGNSSEWGRGIAVDSAGNMYVTGSTYSPNFPTVNTIDGILDGFSADWADIFVAKIDASGTHLLYSTYLGGSNDDFGMNIAIDNAGNAYVTGYTESPEFPRVNAFDGNFDGYSDAFVTKIDASGTSLSYSTYLGGNGWESGDGIAVDSAGNAYVTGYSRSSDFPTVNAIDGSLDGYSDAFVTKIDVSGASLSYSTYLGGNGSEWGRGIVVDSAGNAYVTGHTGSSDFPTVNAIDENLNASTDAFVTKIEASGASLSYSTYLGGNGSEWGRGIAVDSAGNAYVTGETRSSDFPTVNAIDGSLDGSRDAFVTKIDTSGISLSYSTYLGGNDYDEGIGIAVDDAGNAYVTGITSSADFPTVNAIDGIFNGSADAFVAKIVQDTLRARYAFDEGSGIDATDSSGNGNNGTIHGAAWSSGISGAGLNYDGVDDSVDFPTNLGITGELTVSAWVYPTAAPNGAGRIIATTHSWGGTGASRRGWTLGIAYGSTDQIQFRVFDNAGNFASANLNNFFANHLNQWTHVTGVFNPFAYARLYVNGVMVAQDTSGVPSSVAYQSGINLRLGMRADNPAQGMWQGGIDEVDIYSRALSEQEVLDLFHTIAPVPTPTPAPVPSPTPTAIPSPSLTPTPSPIPTCSCTPSPTPTPTPNPNLMAHYEFTEGSGPDVTDSSGNGNDGAINGAVWSSGISGAGLSFDGVNDSVDFPTNLGITGELTVSAWVYPTAAPNGLGRIIAATYNWSNNAALRRGWSLGLDSGSDDRIRFRVHDSSGSSASVAIDTFFADNLNRWTHVVGVFSPSEHTRLYVNGIMVSLDVTNIPAAIAYAGGVNLRLGMRADTVTRGMWQGGIDDVRIYDQALSDQEVLDLYNQFSLPVPDPDLQAQYEFNEGSGPEATDSTGNGNDGAINGAAWSSGISGAGLSFDGVDDSVDFPTNLGITGELTVSAWVYPTAAPSGTGRIIAATYDWDSNASLRRGWSLGLDYGSADRILFRVHDSLGSSASVAIDDFFADNLNRWTHVVGVFSPSQQVRVYINGAMAAEGTTGIPAAIAYQAGINLRLGARADSNGGRWQGGIDEVRIYSRALSDQEVLDLYNGL
ncbi:MAG: SBBP repeat-containing protein [Candidatus Brocadiaceae bacterium]|nr:SBBP repeat-containing protein [Candidatus Brocadiaceae bacterium]